MKKKLLITLCSLAIALVSIIVACFYFVGCKPEGSKEKKSYSTYSFGYFDTVTSIKGYASGEDEFGKVVDG